VLVLITIKTIVKLLAFVNCCCCQNVNVIVGNDYTDKLICRARERGGKVIAMISISFYLGNRRRVLPNFSKHICPPWPETVPAPLINKRSCIQFSKLQSSYHVVHNESCCTRQCCDDVIGRALDNVSSRDNDCSISFWHVSCITHWQRSVYELCTLYLVSLLIEMEFFETCLI